MANTCLGSDTYQCLSHWFDTTRVRTMRSESADLPKRETDADYSFIHLVWLLFKHSVHSLEDRGSISSSKCSRTRIDRGHLSEIERSHSPDCTLRYAHAQHRPGPVSGLSIIVPGTRFTPTPCTLTPHSDVNPLSYKHTLTHEGWGDSSVG